MPEIGYQPAGGHRRQRGLRRDHVLLVRLAVRARRRKARLGADALIGSPAIGHGAAAPEGHVLVEGEIWRAVSTEPVPKGATLRVVGHEQYLLRVVPVDSAGAAAPRTARCLEQESRVIGRSTIRAE